MPKGPLIEHRSKRELAIAISMGLLLAASLIAAVIITSPKLF